MDTLENLLARNRRVQENIMKSFGYESTEDYIGLSTTDAIRKGIVEFDDEIQKAVYADTAENRKLGRVGQEYTRKRKNKGDEYDGKQTGTFKQSDSFTGRGLKKWLEKNPDGGRHTDFIADRISDEFGSELKKKYGDSDMSNLMMDGKIDDSDFVKYAGRLSGDSLKKISELFKKERLI